MAEEREPPPLENEPDLFGEDDDDDDIFKSALSQPKIEVNTESVAQLDPEPAAQLDPEPAAELSAHVDAEVDENIIDAKPYETVTVTEESKEDSAKPVEPTTLDLSAPSNDPDDGDDLFATPSSDLPVKKETVPSSSLTLNGEKPSADMLTPEEEAEAKDQFNIEISVNNPSKVGDGMNAYMVYQVNTVTSIPAFQKSQFSVKRRFSDFLGLHEKLVISTE
ncbi:SNX1 [Bugula neritina]|uniref:SNX1 n=1 Tax=Bugula neritina TaxID=10212 RepID=A0A7J7JJ92_BUGNE|nr:SNX1 [Bugula neritina]